MSQDYMTSGGSGMTGTSNGNRMNMQDAMRTTQERMQQARDFVANQATQHPMMTTAVALGAGMLIGMMMSGGNSQRR